MAQVTGDATYTATYSSTVNKYTVTFEDEDGTALFSAEYDYGTVAADIVAPSDPAKPPDEQYTYAFAGWNAELAEVTADAARPEPGRFLARSERTRRGRGRLGLARRGTGR